MGVGRASYPYSEDAEGALSRSEGAVVASHSGQEGKAQDLRAEGGTRRRMAP